MEELFEFFPTFLKKLEKPIKKGVFAYEIALHGVIGPYVLQHRHDGDTFAFGGEHGPHRRIAHILKQHLGVLLAQNAERLSQ